MLDHVFTFKTDPENSFFLESFQLPICNFLAVLFFVMRDVFLKFSRLRSIRVEGN